MPHVPIPEFDNPDYATFATTMQPLVDLTREFVAAAQTVMNDRARYPGADSHMMEDIVNEAPLIDADRDFNEPIANVGMIASLALFAGQESVDAFARLILHGPPPPVFTADILCRTAIDAVRTTWWLTELRISTTRRVKRVVAELLYSADEMIRLKSDSDVKDRGAKRLEQLLDYAGKRSWPISGGDAHRSVDGEARLTFRQFLEAHFGSGTEAKAAAHGVWAHLSAVTHGSHHGLIQSIDPTTAEDNVGISGTTNVAISSRLELAAGIVASATMQFLTYAGWRNAEVDAANAALVIELRRLAISRMHDGRCRIGGTRRSTT